jgi:hypothetical protein
LRSGQVKCLYYRYAKVQRHQNNQQVGRSNREIGIKDTIEDFYELQRKQQRGKEGQQQFLLLLKEKVSLLSNLKINSLEMIKLGPIWKRFFTTTLPPPFSLSPFGFLYGGQPARNRVLRRDTKPCGVSSCTSISRRSAVAQRAAAQHARRSRAAPLAAQAGFLITTHL